MNLIPEDLYSFSLLIQSSYKSLGVDGDTFITYTLYKSQENWNQKS